ncbi:MAG TPA: aminopeptidase P family protein [Chloroflexota bacterium]|nr:aminopeptidase P family protein [Chloroflexota bacterium]
MDYTRRIEAVRRVMDARGLQVLIVGQPANRQYLSGFAHRDETAGASAGWIVLTDREGFLITTSLYYDEVAMTVQHLEPVRAERRILDGLITLLSRLPGAAVGFEASWMTVDVHRQIAEALGRAHRSLVPSDDLIGRLRAVKDAEEIDILRRAIALTDRVYSEITRWIRPGQTEREVAWQIERTLREGGAEGMAFEPSVAAGPHAAVPHHRPSDRPIQIGEPIWIDMGARLAGYCADLTRSFCLETAPPDFLEAYDLVLRAQRVAMDGLRPGLDGRDGDALAREVITQAGHGDEFIHSLGHGVGLDIHEAPSLGRSSEDVLEPGMVVTIEPGVYRPGWGGVRIEDVALITVQGREVLTGALKQPVLSLT